MNGKIKSLGGFYVDDAAAVVQQAARLQAPATAIRRAEPQIPAVVLEDRGRPPLAPDAALNQNSRAPADWSADGEASAARWASRLRLARLAAWLVFLPWYVGVALAAIVVNVVFLKEMLGL